MLSQDSAYITEVHHITGEGEDAGIVYSEMQASINSGERLIHIELLRAAYPGKCGYKSITEGILQKKHIMSHKDFIFYLNL